MNDTMNTTKQMGPILGLLGLVLAIGGIGGAGSAWTIARMDVQTHIVDEAARQVNERIGSVVVPVGTIIAWHKNPNPNDRGKKLTLPDGWVECDGEPLPAGSPLRSTGATHTPDLNGVHDKQKVDNPDGTVTLYGYNLFLRGGKTSGAFERDAVKHHRHGVPNGRGNFMITTPSGGVPYGTGGPQYRGANKTGYDFVVDAEGTEGGNDAEETRPVNMSVVWIMRVN